MVKEREEIDHDQDEDDRERKRRRRKFRRGLAITFSIALLLLAIGAIGYFLFQIPLNVWLWVLAGILALILTLGVVRVSGIAGVAVLAILLGGGWAYLAFGPCGWPLHKKCEVEVAGEEDDEECDDGSAKCDPDVTKPIVYVPPEFAPPTGSPYGSVIDRDNYRTPRAARALGCRPANELASLAKPLQCIKVFFATSRDVIRSEESVRFIVDRTASEGTVYWGRTELELPLLEPITRRFQSGNDAPTDEPTVEDFDIELPTRSAEQVGRRLDYGISLIEESPSASQFAGVLAREAQKTDGRILVYVHGLNTSFDASIISGGQLSVDLSFSDEDPFAFLSDPYANQEFGIPVVFSWPSENSFQEYFLAREDARLSGEAFRKFVDTLWAQEEIKEVNFIFHSMGNYLFSKAIDPETLEKLTNGSKSVRLFHMAADASHTEYLTALDLNDIEVSDSTDISVYASDSDAALQFSYDLPHWLSDGPDRCRVGLINADCDPINITPYHTIDVSGLGTDNYRHGYFENAPTILADIACSLRGLKANEEDTSKGRALRGSETAGLWVMDPARGATECKITTFRPFIDENSSSRDDLRHRFQIETETGQICCFSLKKVDFNDDVERDVQQLLALIAAGNSDIEKVTLYGHTDTSNIAGFDNVGLSQRRADAVKQRLIQSGVDGNLIDARGLGESQPLNASNENGQACDEDNVRCAANRRVEYAVEYH